MFELVLFSAVPGGDQERRRENTKQVVILYPYRTLTPFNRSVSSGKPRKESNSIAAHVDDYCEHVRKRCCPGYATWKSDRVCGLNRCEFEIRSNRILPVAYSLLTVAEYLWN